MFVLSKKCVPLHSVLINTSRLTTKQKRKMKKLLFAFVALAAMSFASCGNAQKGEATDSVQDSTVDTTAVDTTADTLAVDTTAQA